MNEEFTTSEKLAAWYEWRKWCSILRVKDPQPLPEEIARGLTDDLTRSERKRFYTYLEKRLKSLIWGKFLNVPGGRTGEEDHVRDRGELPDFISCFDEFMKGEKPKISAEDAAGLGSRNTYKDFIFHKMSVSSDPPLKVLNGKIFGDKGYWREIYKRYLLMNRTGLTNRSGGEILLGSNPDSWQEYLPGVPLDAPVETPKTKGENNGSEVIDTVPGSGDFSADLPIGVRKFCAGLSLGEKAFFIAGCYGLPVYAPELLEVLGVGKTQAYMKYEEFVEKMKQLITPDESPAFLRAVEEEIILQLRPENCAENLLKRVTEMQKTYEGGPTDVQQ